MGMPDLTSTVKAATQYENARKSAAASGNVAAASLGNPGNPGLDAKARGIRGGVHYTPDPPAKAPQMHTGGTVPKDGTYELKRGETVIPAKEIYVAGSEGSRICKTNPKKYAVPALSEHSPGETDHPIAPPDHQLQAPADNEVIRRKANRRRDNSRRWGVINDAMGTSDRKSPA